MGEQRRKWEQQIIGTAALMGAIFTSSEPPRAANQNTNKISNPNTNKISNLYSVNVGPITNTNTKVTFSLPWWPKQWMAAYWYLVHEHHLSMHDNGELYPCAVPDAFQHVFQQGEKAIRLHQSRTAERIKRSEIEKDRKWRRDQKNLSR